MSKAVVFSRSTLPPGPKGSFFGGSLKDIGPRRVDFFLDLARNYGPLASFRTGRWHLFLASDPNLIQQVLVTDAKSYIKHFGARTFKPVLGNGLVTSEGDFWLRQRRLLQPAFLKAQVQSYAPTMSQLTERMLADWSPGKSVNIEFEFSALTSAIALKTLFGLDERGDRKRIDENLRLTFELLTARLDTPFRLPHWVPTRSNVRLNRALSEVRKVVESFIAAGRARPPGGDLLSIMIAAQHEDGTVMDDCQLRDEAMTLYLAGHETTALALTWCWYLLSQNSKAEQKLAEEWESVLGGRAAGANDLASLPYTAAVINESMRLYPPVYVIGREATTDLELGGYRVKRGYTVLMSQWVNHRDSKYFPEPDRFLPERWLDGLASRLPKFAYYPFGGGQRICIGSHFALTEAAIVLATVGQKYRFTVAPDAVIDINPQITLPPKHGMPATLERRG
ncbi:cytochrome P450 [Hyphomicrobium sp.]|jgi:cytochrome P450|uniref:cytochrome P450 n=1 Tax=Hyphomicrobium sp. TaxID=82 RepID=UPI002C40D65F|nr:cytochrome P450 [Hyphomicrobium sp.]HVZ03148.1 cytochrome P450 [Hyphomicrobium sp.]